MNRSLVIDESTAAGPATPTTERVESAPSPRLSRTPKKMPSTSLNGTFTITPASGHSISSLNGSPSCSSYAGSPYYLAQQPSSLATSDSFHLPDPLLPPTTPVSVTYSAPLPRQNGLTRKLSSGKRALSRLGRTTSSGNSNRREPSSGPVARRRSDSKTSTAATFESDEPLPKFPNLSGLGLYHNVGLVDDSGSLSDHPGRGEHRAEIVAPAIPAALLAGCCLTKITKRKCQEKTFSLDKEGSTVCWVGRVNKKQFFIDNIKSIRPGVNAAGPWVIANGVDIDPARYFTVNYAPSQSSKDTKMLYLLAPTKHICQLWVNTLEALAKHREELMLEMTGSERLSVLRAHWESELVKQAQSHTTVSSSGLDLSSVTALCRKLHIHCSRTTIEDGFKLTDSRGVGFLDFDQFRAFVRRLRSRVDLRPLFNQYKTLGMEGISKEDFLYFLHTEQGVDLGLHTTYWTNKFGKLVYGSDTSIHSDDAVAHMDFSTFTAFITSKDCQVHATPEKQIAKLDQPLNEYFISSSHNTYLMGRQVNGTSSVEPYVTALKKGCRSVEIDCWDGEHNNPRVTHGYTGTSSISFAEVIRAINRCAFEASQYPVILSLEVHCNAAQQARMVEIMEECIDPGKLLMHPLPDSVYKMPSPEDLKEKILVKVKATNAHPSLQSFGEALSSTRQRSTSSPVRKSTVHPSVTSNPAHNVFSSPCLMSPPESVSSPTDQSMTPTSDEELGSDTSHSVRTPASGTAVRKTSKITSRLAGLGVYLQGYSYRSPVDLDFTQFNHIFSINEHTAISVSKNQDSKIPFEKHNTSFMCRVYPKNTRINSSNFDPNTFWRRGVQMVALNWQTYDIHMQMNQAMFAAGSDQTGFVLKPAYLRDLRRFNSAIEFKSKLPHHQINFSIKVISAQQLPLLSTMSKNELISPFVQVQMFSAEDAARSIACGQGGEEVSRSNGYHGIGKPFSRRTKTVPENGFNPQFNGLIELSLETKYPELVFVRFVVYQSGKGSNKELAVFTSKLDSLQQGYRHLPLYNSNGEELIFSTLFCHITKQKPVLIRRDGMPARHGSFRKLLSRNTSERGRSGGNDLADSDRIAVQRKLNEEIEAKRHQKM